MGLRSSCYRIVTGSIWMGGLKTGFPLFLMDSIRPKQKLPGAEWALRLRLTLGLEFEAKVIGAEVKIKIRMKIRLRIKMQPSLYLVLAP